MLGGFLTIRASKIDIISCLFLINSTWVECIQQLDLAAWEVSQQKIQDRAGFWHLLLVDEERGAQHISPAVYAPELY